MDLTGTVPSRPSDPPVGGVYELTGIPVGTTTPVDTPVNYVATLGLPGFDLKNATTGPLAADH